MSIRINGIDKESTLHQNPDIDHGMYRMHANKNLYEPARQNNFEFIISADSLTGLTNVVDNKSFGSSEAIQDVLRMSVISSSVPHYSVEAITQRRGNSVQKFAGQVSFNEGSLQIYDWIGIGAKEIIMSWMNQVYDVNTDKIGLLADYKKDAELIEYTPDWQPIRKWIMYGCWPSSMTEETFDHTSSAERKISLTIQYDLAKLVSPDAYSNGSGASQSSSGGFIYV